MDRNEAAGQANGRREEDETRQDAPRGADLEGLHEEAVSELEQERAERRALESRQAAETATASRLAFEDRQRELAKEDAAWEEAREARVQGDREQYDQLLKVEADAKNEAEAAAREAGWSVEDEMAADDKAADSKEETAADGKAKEKKES